MRRALFAFAALALVAQAARAQDDFQWDATKKRAPAVGDRYFQVNEDLQQIKSKISLGKEAPKAEDSSSSLKYRVLHEVLAVDGDKVTKERITIERWSAQKESSEPEDKSLTGKTIVVEGSGEGRKVTWENGQDGVTDDGKRWIDVTFARADPMDQIEKLLPKKPIQDGAEWDLDVKALGDEIFKGTEIDPQRSTAKGTLKNVRVEDGVHVGDIEIKIALQLKSVPNTGDRTVAWKEGGLVDLVVTVQGSLEPAKSRKRAVKMDLKLKGRAEQESEEGTINVKMDMRMTTSFTSGEMPKK